MPELHPIEIIPLSNKCFVELNGKRFVFDSYEKAHNFLKEHGKLTAY